MKQLKNPTNNRVYICSRIKIFFIGDLTEQKMNIIRYRYDIWKIHVEKFIFVVMATFID